MHALDNWVPPQFVSENMFSIRWKVDYILSLVELKSYTHVQHKFNQVYQDQTAQISRPMMHWNRHLTETGSVLQQHGLGQCGMNMQSISQRLSQVCLLSKVIL